MIEYGDGLRCLLEAEIGPITPDSITVANVINGNILCLVSLNNWTKGDIELMGSAKPGGITRRFIRELMWYVFDVLKCNRVTARCTTNNVNSWKLLERLGFQCEGLLRQAENGKDVLIYGLLRKELRYG